MSTETTSPAAHAEHPQRDYWVFVAGGVLLTLGAPLLVAVTDVAALGWLSAWAGRHEEMAGRAAIMPFMVMGLFVMLFMLLKERAPTDRTRVQVTAAFLVMAVLGVVLGNSFGVS